MSPSPLVDDLRTGYPKPLGDLMGTDKIVNVYLACHKLSLRNLYMYVADVHTQL
jgi:hypothetical protein